MLFSLFSSYQQFEPSKKYLWRSRMDVGHFRWWCSASGFLVAWLKRMLAWSGLNVAQLSPKTIVGLFLANIFHKHPLWKIVNIALKALNKFQTPLRHLWLRLWYPLAYLWPPIWQTGADPEVPPFHAVCRPDDWWQCDNLGQIWAKSGPEEFSYVGTKPWCSSFLIMNTSVRFTVAWHVPLITMKGRNVV